MTKQRFMELLQQGKTDVVPRESMQGRGAGGAQHGAQGSMSSSSGSSMSEITTLSAQTSANSRDVDMLFKRMEGMEESHKQTQDLLIKMCERLERMPVDPAAARAKDDRRAASRVGLAAAAEATRARMADMNDRLMQIEDVVPPELKTDNARCDNVDMVSGDPLSDEYWSDPAVLEQCHAMLGNAIRASYEQSHAGDDKCGQPVAQLQLGENVTIDALMDTGCMPCGLMKWETFITLQQAAPKCFGEVATFHHPKPIAGVGQKVAAVTAAVYVYTTVGGRPVTVCAGLMENGNTGMVDLMIGNYHMRNHWNFEIVKRKHGSSQAWDFVINTPEDEGEPMRLPLVWMRRSKGQKVAEMVESFPVMPKPWNMADGVEECKQETSASVRGRGRARAGRVGFTTPLASYRTIPQRSSSPRRSN